MSSAAQPILNWREDLTKLADKLDSWDKPVVSRKKADGTLPTAKELHWADQPAPQKLTAEGPKLGQTKKAAAKKKTTQAAQKRP